MCSLATQLHHGGGLHGIPSKILFSFLFPKTTTAPARGAGRGGVGAHHRAWVRDEVWELLKRETRTAAATSITCWPRPARLAVCASPECCLSSNANHPPWRRWSHIALPDCSVIELNGHTVRRIDSGHIPVIGPDLAHRRKRIGPGSGRLTGFVEEV
jgi:hypothetical protein